MQTVKLWNKEFRISYPAKEIQADIARMAKNISKDLEHETNPLFICVLNGSFMFTADLVRHFDFPCEVTFVKLSSYKGTSSTGMVNELIGLTESIKDRVVFILEDIVDTGLTLNKLTSLLGQHQPKDVRVATLLFKPESYRGTKKIDYVGRSIPNDFIVGYGLDYDGIGRNLKDIYTLIE